MATITGLTSARMLAIEAASVVSGAIVGNDLILTKFDASTVNAGNVRGAVGPAGPDGNPVGTILMGGWATEPTNYRFLNGQTLTGGVASFPTIATQFPNWVSGGNLVLPNAMDGAVPLGASTGLGIVSGSMTHTITSDTQLPSHGHTMVHTHTSVDHAHAIDSHQHQTADHQHGMDHAHSTSGNGFVYWSTVYGSGAAAMPEAGSVWALSWHPTVSFTGSTTGAIGGIGNTTGLNLSGAGTSTYGATGGVGNVTNSQSASSTGNTGASATINHTPRNITVKYAVKVL